MRHGLMTAIALTLSAATPAVSQPAQSIEWSIARGGSQSDLDKVQLTFEAHWSPRSNSVWSNDYALADLPGLTPAQVTGPRQPVQFAMVRAPGRLDCSGVAGNLSGRGACRFTASGQFSTYLESRGIGRPDERQSYSLMMSRVGPELIDSMQAIGYARPTVDQLVAMGIHEVTPGYVRGLAASGYRLESADDLVAFRIHGVTLDYLKEMAAIGPNLRHLSAEDIVSLRIHGVKPEYVESLRRSGYA